VFAEGERTNEGYKIASLGEKLSVSLEDVNFKRARKLCQQATNHEFVSTHLHTGHYHCGVEGVERNVTVHPLMHNDICSSMIQITKVKHMKCMKQSSSQHQTGTTLQSAGGGQMLFAVSQNKHQQNPVYSQTNETMEVLNQRNGQVDTVQQKWEKFSQDIS